MAAAVLLGVPSPKTAAAQASQSSAAAPATIPPSSAVPEAPRPPGETVYASENVAVEKVTFAESIRRALAQNPTAQQAQDEVNRFHALMEQVRSASLPTLAGYGTYTRLDSDRVQNGVVVANKGELQLNLTVDVPIISPKTWVQWGQAADQIDVARANQADVRRTVAVSTARAYIAIMTQKRLLDTAKTARDNAKGHYDFTRAQRVGGVGNRLDEVRAAQEYTTEEVNLQNQATALVRAKEALGIFLATDTAIDVADADTPSQMPTYNDAMTDAEKLRQDVRARERARKAAQRTVDEAWADYVPFLNGTAQPFYENPPTATFPRTGWQAELVLTVPIYDGGLRYGQEHEREALADEARLNAENTLRQARSDVRVGFEEMQRADVALDQANQSAAFAKRALELANIAYRAGATTNLEVIDAERAALDAENAAAIAEDGARQARLDLLAASGRFP
ncbi:MAG TPA: TolC family protein [Polyangiaceae bacterium]|jgi:outer membrane protein TolC|nr:TolC family protein [Polyangiaceae bacterium]